MVVMWDLIPITRRRRLESALRSTAKRIRNQTQQAENEFFEVTTGYETMGLAVV